MTKADTMVEHRLDTEGADPLMLAGVNDRNMHEVSRLFSVRVVLRGNQLVLTGDLPGVERAAVFLLTPVVVAIALRRLGRAPSNRPPALEPDSQLARVPAGLAPTTSAYRPTPVSHFSGS